MTAVVKSLGTMLLRELRTLRLEVEAYPSDDSLWVTPAGISNSGGNLALHLCGNLQHFIGAVLGGSGYQRNREAEFSTRTGSREMLVAEVDRTIAALEAAFERLGDGVMATEYPEPVANVRLDTGDFLIHLQSHLAYHLGQLDYHRRLVTAGEPLGGALAPSRLGSARPLE